MSPTFTVQVCAERLGVEQAGALRHHAHPPDLKTHGIALQIGAVRKACKGVDLGSFVAP